jgi:hypothetical protein
MRRHPLRITPFMRVTYVPSPPDLVKCGQIMSHLTGICQNFSGQFAVFLTYFGCSLCVFSDYLDAHRGLG